MTRRWFDCRAQLSDRVNWMSYYFVIVCCQFCATRSQCLQFAVCCHEQLLPRHDTDFMNRESERDRENRAHDCETCCSTVWLTSQQPAASTIQNCCINLDFLKMIDDIVKYEKRNIDFGQIHVRRLCAAGFAIYLRKELRSTGSRRRYGC